MMNAMGESDQCQQGDSEYERVNGNVMQTKKCQTGEAKEQDHTGAERQQLHKEHCVGKQGHKWRMRVRRADRRR